MFATPQNKRVVVGIMVALAVLIFVLDAQFPLSWSPAPLFVAVVGASMWLPGLLPIFTSAFTCTLLTVLALIVGSRDSGQEQEGHECPSRCNVISPHHNFLLPDT